jgi:hypothetical protein
VDARSTLARDGIGLAETVLCGEQGRVGAAPSRSWSARADGYPRPAAPPGPGTEAVADGPGGGTPGVLADGAGVGVGLGLWPP